MYCFLKGFVTFEETWSVFHIDVIENLKGPIQPLFQFLIVMIGTGAYVWFQVSQNLAIWSLCTLVVSTVLLNIGWIISAWISQGKQPSVLFESIDQD